MPAFNRVAQQHGPNRPVYLGEARRLLVGPEAERWDVAALVSCPDCSALVALVDDPHYREDAEPHRLAALSDWRALVTTRFTLQPVSARRGRGATGR